MFVGGRIPYRGVDCSMMGRVDSQKMIPEGECVGSEVSSRFTDQVTASLIEGPQIRDKSKFHEVVKIHQIADIGVQTVMAQGVGK